MKRYILALSAIIMPLLSHAQSIRRHQISAYVNLGNADTHDFEKELDDFSQGGETDFDCGLPIQYAGYGISYSYNVNGKLKLGVCGGMSFASDNRISPCYVEALRNHEWHNNYILDSKLWYVMPTAEYVWFNKRIVRMYSSASLGVVHISKEKTLDGILYAEVDKEIIEKFPNHWMYGEKNVEKTSSEEFSSSETKFAYQVIPFGFELGSRKFCFFQEWGYGYKGIFTAGVRFSF